MFRSLSSKMYLSHDVQFFENDFPFKTIFSNIKQNMSNIQCDQPLSSSPTTPFTSTNPQSSLTSPIIINPTPPRQTRYVSTQSCSQNSEQCQGNPSHNVTTSVHSNNDRTTVSAPTGTPHTPCNTPIYSNVIKA